MDYKIIHSKADKTVITKISDEKLLIERYYSNGQLKFKAYLNEMPDELRSKIDGTQITPKDYNTTPRSRADGVSSWWHSNGQLFKSVNYLNGLEEGYLEIFHDNGQIMERGRAVANQRIGTWDYFDKEGKLEKNELY